MQKWRPRRGDRNKGQRLVLVFLGENPGSIRQEIFDFLWPDYDRDEVSSLLRTLKTKNAIENRGGRGAMSRWYLKENQN